MGTFLIRGGKPLFGTVRVSGSKNAVLPLLFATLLTHGTSVFSGVPDIGDVRVACRILEGYGARIIRAGDNLRVTVGTLTDTDPSDADLSAIRASTYLLGAALGRFGRVRIGPFGGCRFSGRPIDMHLDAIRAVGGTVEGATARLEKPTAGHICFHTVSVGATVNAILLATAAPGRTVIENPAREPHVIALTDYLCAAGAKIEWTPSAVIVSGAKLHGADARIIPDAIEAGTYLLLGPMTGGNVAVSGCDPEALSTFLCAMADAGADVCVQGNTVSAKRGRCERVCRVTTAPYPGFPTDLQPQFAAYLGSLIGGTVTDTVFPGRFGYLNDLANFGLQFERNEGEARIYASRYHSGTATASDLRGGAACLLCSLAAPGVSFLHGTDTVLRGYADVIRKLHALGADVSIACGE